MGRLPCTQEKWVGYRVQWLYHYHIILGKWLPFKKLWGKHVCLPICVGWNGASSDHYYANIDLHIWYGVLGHEAQTPLRLQNVLCGVEAKRDGWICGLPWCFIYDSKDSDGLFSLFLSRWMVVQGFRDESKKIYRLNGLPPFFSYSTDM